MSAAPRVFIVFALGYLASYAYRGLNIGFGPFLIAEMHLSAADLGTLTSLYFLGFAVLQIPAGIFLDTWGPRRVNACMLLVATLGSVLFAVATGPAVLMLGRLLIGAGTCVCLGAAVQALARHVAMSRLPLLNGIMLAIGGLGGVLVGAPLSWLLQYATWRQVSLGMGVFALAVAGLLWFALPADVPRHAGPRPSLARQWQGMRALLGTARYWRLVSLPVASAGVCFGVQALWVQPYLIEFNGVSPARAASLVSVLGFAMMAGSVGLGALARHVENLGLGLRGFTGACLLLYMLVQALIMVDAPIPLAVLWTSYGVLGSACVLVYAMAARAFPPELLGRIMATTNLLMFIAIFVCQLGVGAVIDLWPRQHGMYPPRAHFVAWLAMLGVQAAAAVWYFWPARTEAAPVPGQG